MGSARLEKRVPTDHSYLIDCASQLLDQRKSSITIAASYMVRQRFLFWQ
jgi:hypothetical protein